MTLWTRVDRGLNEVDAPFRRKGASVATYSHQRQPRIPETLRTSLSDDLPAPRRAPPNAPVVGVTRSVLNFPTADRRVSSRVLGG